MVLKRVDPNAHVGLSGRVGSRFVGVGVDGGEGSGMGVGVGSEKTDLKKSMYDGEIKGGFLNIRRRYTQLMCVLCVLFTYIRFGFGIRFNSRGFRFSLLGRTIIERATTIDTVNHTAIYICVVCRYKRVCLT